MEELINAIESGEARRWLVVMPHQYALRRLRLELARRYGCVFGLRAATFHGLVESLAVGLDGVPPAVPEVVAEEAVGNVAKELPHAALSELLRSPSAQRAALATIRNLKIAGVTPDRLSGIRDDKLKILAELWRRYDNILRNRWLDPADREMRIIDAVVRGNAKPPGFDHLWVSGFPYLPPHHKRLLGALATQLRIHLRLPSDGGRTELFSDNEDLIRRAEEWPAGASAEPLEVFHGDGLVGRLQRCLFAPLADPLEHDPERISVARAPSRYDEVEAAATRILALLGKGVPPERIGLTMRNIGPYDQFIRDVFSRHSIPYHYRRGIPLLQAPPVRLVMKLTEIGQRPSRFDELLALINSYCIRFDHKEATKNMIVHSQVFSERPEKWPPRLEAVKQKSGRQQGLGNEDIEAAAQEFEKLLNRCAELWQGRDPLEKLKALIADFIVLPQGTDNPRDDGDRRALRQLLDLLEGIGTQFDRLPALGLEPTAHPIERLREEIRKQSFSEPVAAIDAVQVLNFFDMGYARVDHLFVFGLDEGTVPAAPFRSNSLLSDSDIEHLRRAGLDEERNLRDSGRLRNDEAQAFLLALGAARLEIRLSYPAINSDGRETSPSPYLSEIERILGIEKQEPEPLPGADLRTIEQVPPHRLALQRQLVRRLFRADLPEEDRLATPTYKLLLERDGEKRALRRLFGIHEIEERRRRALFVPPQIRRQKSDRYSGRIEDRELREKIRAEFENSSWSTRRFEKFGKCPFDFFLEYCLGLEELQLPAEEPTPRDEGSLMHLITKEFVEEAEYPLRDLDSSLKLMNTIVPKAFAHRYPVFKPEDYPPPLHLLRERVRRLMSRFVGHEMDLEDRTPTEELESAFGDDERPCFLTLTGRRIDFGGRFDRIDQYKNPPPCKLVIDYKRSGKGTGFKDSIRGHDLQLPLYLLAAAEIFDIDPGDIRAAIFNLRETELHELNPNLANNYRDWPYFLGLSGTPSDNYDWGDAPPVRLIELLDEMIGQILDGYFPVEGRNGAQVPDPANLVGRWLETPPEFERSEPE